MVVDHGTIKVMEQIAISKFKATCLGVLEEVRKTRRPILVTRFGKPIAEVRPPSQEGEAGKSMLDCMAGTAPPAMEPSGRAASDCPLRFRS